MPKPRGRRSKAARARYSWSLRNTGSVIRSDSGARWFGSMEHRLPHGSEARQGEPVLMEESNGQTHSATSSPYMALTRSIIAVVIGYIIFAGSAVILFQLSGQRPHAAASLSFKAATVVYGMFFAAIGGWVTAWIAARRPIKHGVLLACVIATGAIFSLLFSNAAATWSQWSALVLMAPAATGGAYWRSRHRDRN